MELSEKLEEALNNAAARYLDNVDTESSIIKERLPEIYEAADKVVVNIKDGFSFSDLLILGEMVPEIMAMASKVEGFSNEDKHRFVVDAVWIVYKAIDTGPDGSQNRINIPVLFGNIEVKFEYVFIKYVVGFAIKTVYPFIKNKLNSSSEGAEEIINSEGSEDSA